MELISRNIICLINYIHLEKKIKIRKEVKMKSLVFERENSLKSLASKEERTTHYF